MQDIHSFAKTLRRPSLLIRAARAGMVEYNRNRDLKRLMHDGVPAPEVAVRRLIDAEAVSEMRRQTGDAGYSLVRHVDLLIALLAEISLLSRSNAGA